MRTLKARTLLAALLIAAPIGCANQEKAPVVDQAALTAQLDSVNNAFNEAVAARDTDAVAALYTDDARLLPAGMSRADGKAAIRAMWAGFLRTPGLELTITSTGPMITEAGDMVIDVGTYTMKMTDPKGKQVEDVGKYVTVLKKVDGGLKISIDTFNSDKAPPGM